MDLTQVKLNKTEWDSIEIPVQEKEKNVLKMIIDGYTNLGICRNANISMASYIRMTETLHVDDYIYKEYFEKRLRNIDPTLVKTVTIKKIKKVDLMKLNLNKHDNIDKCNVFESKLIDAVQTIVESANKNIPFPVSYFTLHRLTLVHVSHINKHVQSCVNDVLARYESDVDMKTLVYDAKNVLEKNKTVIENDDIVLYSHQKDLFRALRNPEYDATAKLYSTIISDMRDTATRTDANGHNGPNDSTDASDASDASAYAAMTQTLSDLNTPTQSNLILYSAPTGTGKTLSPLALTSNYRIVFVCAARHVGLALAKNAITMGNKVAFAFGCETAADIRLHYSAASVYSTNRRSGKISRVDNSVGDKVEIMICDVKSYLCAMHYMAAFNPISNLLLYWDEPTISMDYETHPLHESIHALWKHNIIPNIVMSSATLPTEQAISDTVDDFMAKFPRPNIISIRSHDAKKSIPVINKNGFNVMPHFLDGCEDYDEVMKIAENCASNLTLLRYMDLQECIDFIHIVEANKYVPESLHVARCFTNLSDISITKIKEHYLRLLQNIPRGVWGAIVVNLRVLRKPSLRSNPSIDSKGNCLRKINSIGPGIVDNTTDDPPGVYITTKDASTLTGGPTIFLTDDVEKIAKFYLKQAYIPATVLQSVMERVEHNNKLSSRIAELEEKLEDILESAANQESGSGVADSRCKMSSKGGNNAKQKQKTTTADQDDREDVTHGKTKRYYDELGALQRMIKSAELSEVFIPNKKAHLDRWSSNKSSSSASNSSASNSSASNSSASSESSESSAFTSNITDDVVCDIMAIDGVNDTWKVLLLMGIGVFTNHASLSYTEVMKRMATDQRLYLIIASSDYIYGTNYQFCHGYLGKDIALTQQKMLQALGRIGRHNDQHMYSVRLRDNNHGNVLFKPSTNDIEYTNMNKLFTSL